MTSLAQHNFNSAQADAAVAPKPAPGPGGAAANLFATASISQPDAVETAADVTTPSAAFLFSSCGPEEREGAPCDRGATGGGSNPRRESGRRDGKNPRARAGVASSPHDATLRIKSIPYRAINTKRFSPDMAALNCALGDA